MGWQTWSFTAHDGDVVVHVINLTPKELLIVENLLGIIGGDWRWHPTDVVDKGVLYLVASISMDIKWVLSCPTSVNINPPPRPASTPPYSTLSFKKIINKWYFGFSPNRSSPSRCILYPGFHHPMQFSACVLVSSPTCPQKVKRRLLRDFKENKFKW